MLMNVVLSILIFLKFFLVVVDGYFPVVFEVSLDLLFGPDTIRIIRGASTWNDHHVYISIVAALPRVTMQFMRVFLPIHTKQIAASLQRFDLFQ